MNINAAPAAQTGLQVRSPPQGGSTHTQGSRGFTLPVGHTRKPVTLFLPQSSEENMNMKTPPPRRPGETDPRPPPTCSRVVGRWRNYVISPST